MNIYLTFIKYSWFQCLISYNFEFKITIKKIVFVYFLDFFGYRIDYLCGNLFYIFNPYL